MVIDLLAEGTSSDRLMTLVIDVIWAHAFETELVFAGVQLFSAAAGRERPTFRWPVSSLIAEHTLRDFFDGDLCGIALQGVDVRVGLVIRVEV